MPGWSATAHDRRNHEIRPARPANPDRHRKTPARQMLEEDLRRNQARHRDDAPPCAVGEYAVGVLKAWNARSGCAERVHAMQEFRRRVAFDELDLPPLELRPSGVLILGVTPPMLLHGVIG